MKTRGDIIAENPLDGAFETAGARLKKMPGNRSFITNRCPAVEHKPAHLCVSLNGEVWRCHDCAIGGSVIDFWMALEGIDAAEAMRRAGGGTERQEKPKQLPPVNGAKVVKTYDYTDEAGDFLFQVCRMEPKTFRQRHRANGEWVWTMDGVRRVLYNLPAVLASSFVWIVEGEKDADTLNGFGFCATCNVGGAGKWDASYTATLKDKDVLICGDNDDAGEKHVSKVLEMLGGAVRTTRRIKVPAQYKDVTQWLEESGAGAEGLANVAESAEVLTRGVRLPIKSMAELEKDYERFAVNAPLCALRISDWLPGTYAAIRPIVPGEMVVVIAGTGVGKTMILQNLALSTGLSTLLFELELPGTLTFERFVAMATKQGGEAVASAYAMKEKVDWRSTNRLDHIHVCSESRLSTSEIERIIENAGLKTGIRPALVLLDYIQLITGKGDRRERIAEAAEDLKRVAKATNTILVVASQIARKKSDPKNGEADAEVSLMDAKESGEIENSAGLVLGVWKETKTRMLVKVLKNTKGTAGNRWACDIKTGLVIEQAPTHQQPTE